MIRLLGKSVFYGVFLLFFLLSLFALPVSAQECASSVVVDMGSCDPNIDEVTGARYCSFDVSLSNVGFDCNPSTCKTYLDVCSSNDCLDVPDGDGNCYKGGSSLSCSPASCGGGGGGGCDASPPGGLAVNWGYSPTQVRFSWNPGANGNSQAIGVADNTFSLLPLIDCNPALGGDCIIIEQGLPTSQNEYFADLALFSPGTTYYWGIVNVAGVCSLRATAETIYTISSSPTPTPTSTPVGSIVVSIF